MLSIIKIEQQNLNTIWDCPEYIYKFDRPYFISEIANDIFITIKKLYENGIKITISDVVIYGNSRNKDITKENIEFLRTQDYDIQNFDFYFDNLKKNYAKNKIEEKVLKEIVSETSSKGELDVDRIQEISNTLQENLDIITGKESVLQSIETIGMRYRGVLVARKLGNYSFSSGDSILDSYLLAGFAPGNITTIFGSSGVGKSAFAMNLFNKQINKRIPSMYIALEMDEISTMDRLMSNRKRIPSKFLYFKGEEESMVAEDTFKTIEEGLTDLMTYDDRFFLVDDPSVKLRGDLELLIKEAKKRMRTDYLICTIDLLTMMSDFGAKAFEIEESMNVLSAVAKRQGVHIVAIVQANRDVEKVSVPSIDHIDKLRPKSMVGIKNSAAIGERSRIILSVFRPKHFAKELFPEDESIEYMDETLDITIVKQSQGAAGAMVRYLYDPETFRTYPYIQE